MATGNYLHHTLARKAAGRLLKMEPVRARVRVRAMEKARAMDSCREHRSDHRGSENTYTGANWDRRRGLQAEEGSLACLDCIQDRLHRKNMRH